MGPHCEKPWLVTLNVTKLDRALKLLSSHPSVDRGVLPGSYSSHSSYVRGRIRPRSWSWALWGPCPAQQPQLSCGLIYFLLSLSLSLPTSCFLSVSVLTLTNILNLNPFFSQVLSYPFPPYHPSLHSLHSSVALQRWTGPLASIWWTPTHPSRPNSAFVFFKSFWVSIKFR